MVSDVLATLTVAEQVEITELITEDESSDIKKQLRYLKVPKEPRLSPAPNQPSGAPQPKPAKAPLHAECHKTEQQAVSKLAGKRGSDAAAGNPVAAVVVTSLQQYFSS